jgi:hypothetical protein
LVSSNARTTVSGFTKFKHFFHEKPTIVVSIALAVAGPVLLWGVYPWRRSNGYKRPADAPLSYPVTIRPREYPAGFEDE